MTRTAGLRLATTVALRQPLDAIREQVMTVEALGYHSVWLPEVTDRDAFVLSAALAASTTAIGIATGVVAMPTRSLPLLAMGAAAAAEASHGRFWLGVGAGHAELVGPWHQSGSPAPPADVVGALSALRRLLGGETLEGKSSSGQTPYRLRRFGGHVTPIVLGGLSEAMMRAAGKAADGVLLNWVTAERAGRLATVARSAAAAAGRDPALFTVAAYLPVAVTDEVNDARVRLARQLGAYARLEAYRRGLERCGLGASARRAAEAGPDRPGEVPGELLDALGAIGPAEFVRARVDEFRFAGVDLPVLAPVPAGSDPWGSMITTWTELAISG